MQSSRCVRWYLETNQQITGGGRARHLVEETGGRGVPQENLGRWEHEEDHIGLDRGHTVVWVRGTSRIGEPHQSENRVSHQRLHLNHLPKRRLHALVLYEHDHHYNLENSLLIVRSGQAQAQSETLLDPALMTLLLHQDHHRAVQLH